jgi:DNA-binding CsgD family transcriptional regulator
MDILQRIAEGLPDKQIATKMGISPHTVRNHIANIYAKLEVNTRMAAAAKLRPRP